MRLITAHKILIGSSTIFFCFFALWELNRYFKGNGDWAAARSALYFIIAVGFAIYLKNFKRWYK
jgi:hypothetical protein